MRFSFLIVFGIVSSAGALGQSAPPAITSQPASATANAGQAVTLSVTATGNPVPAIQWFKDGRAIPGATNAALTFASVFGGDAGSYTANVSNVVNGTSYTLTSAPAVLTVVTTPPTITTQPVSQTVVAGGNVTFSVTATGSPLLLYRWYRDGLEVPGATGSTLTLIGTQSGDAGSYRVAVINWSTQIKAISAGDMQSLFITNDGTLWGMGSNNRGALGAIGADYNAPIKVASGVTGVSAGVTTRFVKSDGTLWGMGYNLDGRLGDGTLMDRWAPVQLATGVANIDAGMFVKTDGSLWGVGLNGAGQLGDGTTTNRTTPVQVASGVVSVSAGSAHTMFLKTDGSLWGMGLNRHGQLGDGTRISRLTPVQVAADISSVSAYNNSTLFVKSDGTLWGVGENGYGALGDGGTVPRLTPVQVASGVARVDAGWQHAMFIKTDGTLWGMGYNEYGQLGDGSKINRSIPVQVASGVVSVSAGNYDTIFLKTDGSLWGMGWNYYGALGDGTSSQRSSPVRVAGGLLSNAATLTVNTPPVITTQPASKTEVVGFPINLVVVTTGIPAPTYQWRKAGSNIPGATNPSYTIPSAAIGDAGSYTVMVTNSVGAVTSSEAVVTVNPAAPAAITGQPANVTANLGQSATLSITISGSPAPTIQWLRNGTEIAGATNATLTINSVAPGDAATYTATVRNVFNGTTYSLTTTPAALSIAGNPISFSMGPRPAAVTVFTGQALALSASGVGPAAPVFQWRKDGVAIPGATTATYAVPAAGVEQAGTYSVVVSGGTGSVISGNSTVTVIPSRLINLSILTPLGSGEVMTLGTVLGGAGTSGSKALLIRGAGPALAQLGVAGFMPDPRLDLYQGQTLAAANDDWGGNSQLAAAFAAVGAFSYASASSLDAAIYGAGFAPGSYTVQVRGGGSSAGTVIAELYDSTPTASLSAATPRLVNVSVLKEIRSGDALTAGFVVGGFRPHRVLIRAVGPTLGLSPFNIGGVMSDPKLTLYSGQQVIATNDNWGSQSSGLTAAQITAVADGVGAFRIGNEASRDAVLLVTLSPGNYTAQISAASGVGGLVITEVYEVP